VSGTRLLQVAVRATAMASTMSNAAMTARTTAGYAPARQRGALHFALHMTLNCTS
jgi:hypothetical protein